MSRSSALFLAAVLLISSAYAQVPAGQSLVQQFQHIEDSWSIALVNKDQYAMENLLAPAFVDISAAGAVSTRNQTISDALAGQPEPVLSIEQKVVNVRVVSDVAVVEGTYVLHVREQERTRDERGIFTHVFQRSHNEWSCISAQRTAVVDQLTGGKVKAPAAQKPAAEKKSGASLPFHIPLLHKGPAPSTPEQTPPTTSNPPQ